MTERECADEYPGQQRTVNVTPKRDYLPIHDHTPLTIEKSNGIYHLPRLSSIVGFAHNLFSALSRPDRSG